MNPKENNMMLIWHKKSVEKYGNSLIVDIYF